MVPCSVIYFYQIRGCSLTKKGERTSCYFIISVPLEPGKDRADYNDYIKLVRPIVEKHGKKYVVRNEGIEYMGRDWRPSRFIMIWFPNRESIDRYSSSEKYKRIMSKRGNTVDSQAVIITANEVYGDGRDKRKGEMG